MKFQIGDIFDIPDTDAILIPTNGCIKRNGHGIVGAGIAKVANDKFPEFGSRLGANLKTFGNVPSVVLSIGTLDLVNFPTKPGLVIFNNDYEPLFKYKRDAVLGKSIQGWKLKSDLALMKESAERVVALADMKEYKKIVLPEVGCGEGGLNLLHVVEILEPILDDRFIMITMEE